MEFMYCIPDLDVFIDRTIKKCLLEYDLEREDTESVLDDIEKIISRPMDEDNEFDKKFRNGGNPYAQKRWNDFRDTNSVKYWSSDLGAVQYLPRVNSTDKIKAEKVEVIASLLKDTRKILNLPGGPSSTDSSRCPSTESKSSSPDLSESQKLHTKLKSRLQRRYFQNVSEPYEELRKDREDQKPSSPITPASGYFTTTGSDCEHPLSLYPIGRDFRKRSASRGDTAIDLAKSEINPHSKAENLGSLVQDKPRAKVPRLIEYPVPPNSTSSHKPNQQTLKYSDDSSFSLYCLAFRSSSDGSVPIENLNRSMQVPILLKEKGDISSVQKIPSQTKIEEKHQVATNIRPLSDPIHNASQPTQKHVARIPKTNNRQEGFQVLKKGLEQRNYRQKHQEINSAPLASLHQHRQQEFSKCQQGMNACFRKEVAAAENVLGHTSLISNIIAEELMKFKDNSVRTSAPSSIGNIVNSQTPTLPNGTSVSDLDVHTTDTRTLQPATSTCTPSSQVPPLIAVPSWHTLPPLVQPQLATSQTAPLIAHQNNTNASTVCVKPDSPICMKSFPSPPIDTYDDILPQDLSQKSSRRRAEEALNQQ